MPTIDTGLVVFLVLGLEDATVLSYIIDMTNAAKSELFDTLFLAGRQEDAFALCTECSRCGRWDTDPCDCHLIDDPWEADRATGAPGEE